MIVGVIGAGVIGIGVAQCFAQGGYDVVLVDICEDILSRAKQEIHSNIRFQALFNKNIEVVDPDTILSKICTTTDYNLLKECDFIIENVSEKLETKRVVYEKIDDICKKECKILVNTSCISITKIASLTKRQEQIIGAHFMNPVHLKPVVEVIEGYHTSSETINSTKEILASIGKECIIVKDLPGFVSNRLSHLLINEAAFILQDQVACAEDVDEILKKCMGHKMGPLETADLIGLDTVVNSLDVLYESYHDPKFRCCPLLRKMVDAGLYGKKSGKGFYNY